MPYTCPWCSLTLPWADELLTHCEYSHPHEQNSHTGQDLFEQLADAALTEAILYDKFPE